MFLNTISAGKGARGERRRLGRGIGSGLGKTCGKGHKGQKARAGAPQKTGFEGGQMPLQRRLPKVGFRSRKKALWAEVRVHDLARLPQGIADLKSLKEAKLVPQGAKWVRVIDSGRLDTPVTVVKLKVTGGAVKRIENAGGRIEV